MPEEYVEYVKTPGFAVLDGNKITDAQLGEPAKWLPNYVFIRDMLIAPASIIGKFYNPDDRKAYLNYDCRAGAYDNLVAVSHEDDKVVAIAEAISIKEVEDCARMVKFMDDVIKQAKPVTKKVIPVYVVTELDRVMKEKSPFYNYEKPIKEPVIVPKK